MGLTAGPAVATTLRAIEQRWVREGFPAKAVLDGYAREAVTAAVGRAG